MHNALQAAGMRPIGLRPPISFLGAGGSAVTAAGMSAQCRCMGACAAQALAVRLPRLMLCGATSNVHVLHVWEDGFVVRVDR